MKFFRQNKGFSAKSINFFSYKKYKNTFILGGFILIVCIGAFLLLTQYLGLFFEDKKDEHSLDAYAERIVEVCKDASYRPVCYEKEVPKLVVELESPQIFNVIRLIRKYDPEYLFCHVVAHDLGAYEVSLNPDNWLDVIAKGPTDGLCSNGFAHGAIVTRFNDGKLSPEAFEFALRDLKIACEEREGWNPTELIKAICYHGIGHVFVHMTEADIPISLDGCERVALKDDDRDYRQVCYEGVYMQLFQPLEPEDYALIDQLPLAPTRDNIVQFCEENSSNELEYGTCWREAWPFFYGELFDREGVLNYCLALTEESDQEKCFITAFTINGRHHLGQPEKMSSFCNSLPSAYQGMCLARGANAFPEEDQTLIPEAIDMCSRGASKEIQDECYLYLAQVASFNFHEGSEPFEELCSSLPAEWERQCR